ncbi:MAG: hypothetical protein PHS44_04970 [Candidatus Dojkabacteria bacterium]|nr:hypothetical protein [Candidatus Dojkabacteria bacterium]
MQQFERAADQIKTQAREKQDQVRENMSKTDQGIEQISKQLNSYRAAKKKIQNAISQLQSQAQQNPQLQNHPMYQKRMQAYKEQLSKLNTAIRRAESQIEMLRGRKGYLRSVLIKIAGQASSQLSMIRKRQQAMKQQQQAAQDQQKRKAAKGETGKVRG